MHNLITVMVKIPACIHTYAQTYSKPSCSTLEQSPSTEPQGKRGPSTRRFALHRGGMRRTGNGEMGPVDLGVFDSPPSSSQES